MVDYHLLEVEVFIESNWRNKPLFTGKLVKSLLIDADPGLKQFFEKTSGSAPKLLHISPLYQDIGGRIRCIYSQVKRVNVSSEQRWVAIPLQISGKYRFYLGLADHGGLDFDKVFNAIMNMPGRHIFSNHVFHVEVVSARIIDVSRRVQSIAHDFTSSSSRLRVVFGSPTLLRDPFRAAKHKSLIPTPVNVFSTSIFIYLYLGGRLTRRSYYNLLISMHRIFNEAHTIHDTVRKVWMLYEHGKNPIPAITGYVNYHLNKEYYEMYKTRLDLSVLIEEVLKIMATLGTGTSRATGFGHVFLETR